MQDQISKTLDQALAFQRLWTGSFAKVAGVMTQYSPASPPLEEARKLRAGLLDVLGETTQEFMQSPQFLEMMKTSLNGMLGLRRLSREGMDHLHEQFDTPDKDDIDGVLLAIRHVERRILDRLEGLDERVAHLEEAAQHGSQSADSKLEKKTAAPRHARVAVAKTAPRGRTKAKQRNSNGGKRS